ncbi:hypothetical protein PFICI_08650 [Pestalotiopsis fici W106-1]|uniref:Uncharacterized protein n=1 Tax=Pestalotiopsis fici (strain W106-1 / CGMCC3.15140) TaxID=1229662 RepID=W3X0B9_PESFW|nr:uncharacterized protein PFICI_08650 [Pestalotiopsis fici W106-1]ETS78797.1 hypothetical protein PFICI_08650 [Pestalotiopsis fici W106-1]
MARTKHGRLVKPSGWSRLNDDNLTPMASVERLDDIPLSTLKRTEAGSIATESRTGMHGSWSLFQGEIGRSVCSTPLVSATDGGKPSFTKRGCGWGRGRLWLRLLRLAMSSVRIGIIIYTIFLPAISIVFDMTYSAALLVWDIIYLIDARWTGAFQLSFEIKTFVEVAASVVVSTALIMESLAVSKVSEADYLSRGSSWLVKGKTFIAVGMAANFVQLFTTVFFAYRLARQIKQHYMIHYKGHPIILYTPAGDPVIRVTDEPLVLRELLARRSVDSDT